MEERVRDKVGEEAEDGEPEREAGGIGAMGRTQLTLPGSEERGREP